MSASRRKSTLWQPPAWRLWLIAIILGAMAATLAGRLVLLQVFDEERGASFLKKQGDMRSVRIAEVPVYRGLISDRRGSPLAVSTPVISLWANPQILKDLPDLTGLAAALKKPESTLRERIDRYAGKQFMYLARQQPPEVARAVLALKIPGVRSQREYQRYYPAGEVVSQVVGLTNIDGVGIAGVEKSWESTLGGQPGRRRYIKDLHGDAVRNVGLIDQAVPGEPLSLSIDLRLQYLQHRELQRAIKETGAAAGSIVTLDAWTGEVLAMTNHPSFNPNTRDFDFSATRNRVLTDELEPGSTMKPLTLVAALESGAFDIDTMVDTSPGRIKVGSKVLPDPVNYGEISVSRIIEKSSQVGVTKIAQAIGHEPILGVFHRFGLGVPTSVGFPGERYGQLPDREYWSDIDKVTLAFGYGLTATPLQIAQAYAVFANGGVRVPLTLVRRRDEEFVPQERVVTQEVANQVLEVLHRVTQDEGTATRARVDGYSVGGKTGTVHKVGREGYEYDQYVALFAGVAPVDRPRFVTVVVIDQPKGDSYGGGAVAAPVYSRVAASVLQLNHVFPDSPANKGIQVVALEAGQ